MHTVIRQIIKFISITILASSVITTPVRSVTTHGFQPSSATTASTSIADDIPRSIFDRNFREWRPPRPVPVIPSFAQNDLAWTDGWAIYYNPRNTSQVPAKLIAFVIAHEYGHIYQRTGDEIASDRFAARTYAQVDISVAYAAIWHMANIQPYASDATHPPGIKRAFIIGQAAGLSRPEIEAVIQGRF